MGIISDVIKKQWGVIPKESSENVEEQAKVIKDYVNNMKKQTEFESNVVSFEMDLFKGSLMNNAGELIPGKKEFIIDEENEYYIQTLIYYFMNDERFLKSEIIGNKPDLNKSLLVTGKPGFGKTLIFRAIQKCFSPFNQIQVPKKFKIKSCNSLVNEFNVDGSKTLTRFMKEDNWMFDDFGTENKGVHYKLEEEVMKLILESRYELFTRNGNHTHLTSNETEEKIRKRYGYRVSSRIDEMFNIIVVNGKDRRK